MKLVEINKWPESQDCIGCKHGALIDSVEKYGCSAYICELAISPDGAGECRKREEEAKGNIK